ncbi:MAG: outer membrane lipoprotein-sorting protein [Nitrospinaceae bacterium]
MKRWFRALLLSAIWPVLLAAGLADTVDVQKLLEEVDDNLWSTSKFIEGRLIIDNGRRVRTLKQEVWMQGVTRSFTKYMAPARERGTKMLKVGKKLWMYTPRTDRKILISGHLLRQSMMGSDLSYEDMTEDEKISAAYTGEVEGREVINGVETLILSLRARSPDKTYQKLRVWVDARRKIVLREEKYAKSGRLLKTVEFLDYRPIDGRLFPKKMVFRDALKGNTKTTYVFDRIDFDVNIPPRYFSLSILKR